MGTIGDQEMAKVSGNEVFGTDYNDLEAVKRLARKLGKGMSVLKHPSRQNYNISHTEDDKRSIAKGYTIVWRT